MGAYSFRSFVKNEADAEKLLHAAAKGAKNDWEKKFVADIKAVYDKQKMGAFIGPGQHNLLAKYAGR